MLESLIRWTHPSVRPLADTSDPQRWIIERARQVVFEAVESGWSGPPFDPFALAKMRGIDLLPREDVADARTLTRGTNRFVIEFNPNQPRWRVRYSVAHELAHTLLPDCAEEIRNRSKDDALRPDYWQLELLCNLAAAELLIPVGTFRELADQPADIRALMAERERYDVSAEALILRFVKLTDSRCAAFAAARYKDGDLARYRLDYLIPSRSWSIHVPAGALISGASKLAECTGVGYTTTGDEVWLDGLPAFHVECVGIPPYPGSRFPRVVGVVAPIGASGRRVAEQRLNVVYGSALEPRGDAYKIIVHLVNDKTANWGGSGFATALRAKYPEVQADFRAWARSGPRNLSLGTVHLTEVESGLAVASMIAQHGYGPSSKPRIRYESLEQALAAVGVVSLERRASVHMPRIGSGQAGGTWDVVEELVDQELCSRGVKVTVYDLPA